jgi:hypothetical protein
MMEGRPLTSIAHPAFGSLDEMLSLDALASLLGQSVGSVRREPLTPAGDSSTDAAFEAIHLDGEPTPSFITKTVERARDWVAIATRDETDREVRVWEAGLLDRLPTPATHTVVAGARSGSGYAVLMRNVSDWLLPDLPGVPPPASQQDLAIEAMASIHAAFWMDETLLDPFNGLSSLSEFTGHCAPGTLERIRVRMGASGMADWLEEGWDKLPTLTDARLAEDLRAVADDPTLVAETASAYPWTLAHTDPRPANVAIDEERQLVYFLDWTRPAVAPPAVDLLYWIFAANTAFATPREDLIDAYGAALERRIGSRFSSTWWQPQLDLCFVAFVACFVPIIANVNPDAVAGWTERCRPGLRALG